MRNAAAGRIGECVACGVNERLDATTGKCVACSTDRYNGEELVITSTDLYGKCESCGSDQEGFHENHR